MGDHMPKHLVSGLKYLTVIELKKLEYSTQEIADILDMDRTTVSHYLHGRNISSSSIQVAKVIFELTPQDSFKMIYALCHDEKLTFTILKYCSNNPKVRVKDTCIGCSVCVEICVMNAFKLVGLASSVNLDLCCGCLMCVDNCPTDSIEVLDF